jgi:5-methyltetrahydrofolate--homocysteine methyltransferase
MDETSKDIARLNFLRQQEKNSTGDTLSLSDYVCETGDNMGIFVATAGAEIKTLSQKYHDAGDDYLALLINLLSDRLAEACSEYLQVQLETKWWKQDEHTIIRPASGYPSAPDHSEKETIFNILDAEKHLGISLTESYAMDPVSSVCGYYFAAPNPHYFSLGKISQEQFKDYADRKKVDVEDLLKFYAGKV